MTDQTPDPEPPPLVPVNRVQWEAHLEAHALVAAELLGEAMTGATMLAANQHPKALAAALVSELASAIKLIAQDRGIPPEAAWRSFTQRWQERVAEPARPPVEPPDPLTSRRLDDDTNT